MRFIICEELRREIVTPEQEAKKNKSDYQKCDSYFKALTVHFNSDWTTKHIIPQTRGRGSLPGWFGGSAEAEKL